MTVHRRTLNERELHESFFLKKTYENFDNPFSFNANRTINFMYRVMLKLINYSIRFEICIILVMFSQTYITSISFYKMHQN
jgi:hypothetical protein